MNYTLRTKEELQEEWNKLNQKEQSLRNYMAIELADIKADKDVIELELRLLQSIGKV